MGPKKTFEVLNEILLQFEMNVLEAEIGDSDAVEAEKSNRESVEALKVAIQEVAKKLKI